MIEAVRGQPPRAVGRRRHRLGGACQPAARALPAEVQHPRAVCRLRRPHRREQGLQGAVRRLCSSIAETDATRLSLVLIGNSMLPIPQHPRIRHLGFLDDSDKFDAMAAAGPADHAVVLRKPVDGRARSLGAGPAGARQRPMRRSQRPIDPQQRRPVLREPRRVHRDAARPRAKPLAERHAGQERPPVLPRTLRLAGDRAKVSRHDRPADRRNRAAAPGIEPLPGWFEAGAPTARRQKKSLQALRTRAGASQRAVAVSRPPVSQAAPPPPPAPPRRPRQRARPTGSGRRLAATPPVGIGARQT